MTPSDPAGTDLAGAEEGQAPTAPAGYLPLRDRLGSWMGMTARILENNYVNYWPKHKGDRSDPSERDLTTAFAAVLVMNGFAFFTEVPKTSKPLHPDRVKSNACSEEEMDEMTVREFRNERIDLVAINHLTREYLIVESKNIYYPTQQKLVMNDDVKMTNFVFSKVRTRFDPSGYAGLQMALMLGWTGPNDNLDPYCHFSTFKEQLKKERYIVDSCRIRDYDDRDFAHQWLMWATKQPDKVQAQGRDSANPPC